MKRDEWVSSLLEDARRHRLGMTVWQYRLLKLRERGARLIADVVRPTPFALAVTCVLGIGILAVLLLAFWIAPAPDGWDDRGAYTALWQSHMALAGLALPILVFIIELAKDERDAYQRTSEILIRETFVFPIISFVLIAAVLLAIGSHWFISELSIAVALDIFVVTTGLTLFAYYRVLALLFSSATLKEKGLHLLHERFKSSIDSHARVRIGVNLLLDRLKRIAVTYTWIGPHRNDDRYVFVKASSSGYVEDVNISRLDKFVRLLPWKSMYAPQALDSPPEDYSEAPLSQSEMPAVTLLKVYGTCSVLRSQSGELGSADSHRSRRCA
jgi:hypothetical protein